MERRSGSDEYYAESTHDKRKNFIHIKPLKRKNLTKNFDENYVSQPWLGSTCLIPVVE